MELQSASPSLMGGLRSAETEAPKSAVKGARLDAVAVSPRIAPPVPAAEEMLVPDDRAGVTPAQSVERKLTAMLRGGAAIPVSHFRLAKLCGKK
jgi:hypothetical protein